MATSVNCTKPGHPLDESTHPSLTTSYIRQRKQLTNGKITINGNNLSIPKVLAVSEDSTIQVDIDSESLEEMIMNQQYLMDKLNKGLVVYGINTGFGGSSAVRSNNMEEIQLSLMRLLNAGMGRTFPTNLVRAAMITRANCLSMAYSGVRPIIPGMIVDLINKDIVPNIPVRGSVSASGDLMPLSYIAATVIGREDLKVTKDGRVMSCGEALKSAGLTPIVLGPKEGLAIANACSFAAGVSSTLLYDANLMLLLTQVCTGLSLEALRGRTESFHPVVNRCLPHIGQNEVATNMMSLLVDSKLAITTLEMHKKDKYGEQKQDRYCLRTTAQWLGPVVETLKDACRRVTIELNSCNDNPIIDHRTDSIVSGGNFQGETLSISIDQTRQVIGVCGKLLYAQLQELVDVNLNYGLTPNLSGCDIHTDFGFKGCDIAMAAYMSELDHLVNPMSNHVLSAELHNQSVNSMALVSARLTIDAIEILQMMIANLICVATQAVDLRYLRFLVLDQLIILSNQCPQLEVRLKQLNWYEFVFLPEQTIALLTEDLPSDKHQLVEEVVNQRMMKLYKDVCTGQLGTDKQLGKGTRTMYKFVREELGVRFYNGHTSIDTSLNKILDGIKDRTIEDVLLNIFTP